MTPSVRYGFLGGAVVIFYFALLYIARPELYLNLSLQWGSMVVYLVFMWIATKEDCAAKGTARDFREVVRTPFVTFLLINLCYWIFNYGLRLYDPSLLLSELTIALEMAKNQLTTGVGDPEQADQLRRYVQELENLIKNPQPQPLGPILRDMSMGAIGGFVLAAGIAALVKNQKK
ncbi:MAG: DUF4199 domain-containing protein [Saprospiraceae bacterium]|nr:DUF4199 domain-containing protein [Lewinellaceae bacterium]MBP6810116.1 DUF4199 domain-containing protein [Saprospiraceae bacterium]